MSRSSSASMARPYPSAVRLERQRHPKRREAFRDRRTHGKAPTMNQDGSSCGAGRSAQRGLPALAMAALAWLGGVRAAPAQNVPQTALNASAASPAAAPGAAPTGAKAEPLDLTWRPHKQVWF